MASEFQIIWTDEAIANLENILEYLERRWTEREIKKFKALLSRQLKIIRQKPKLFPSSSLKPELRRAVLSKQTSIYYLVGDRRIHLIYLFDNRMNPRRIQK